MQYLCTHKTTKEICSIRLSVRTSDFHSGKRGSTPLWSTKEALLKKISCLENFSCPPPPQRGGGGLLFFKTMKMAGFAKFKKK